MLRFWLIFFQKNVVEIFTIILCNKEKVSNFGVFTKVFKNITMLILQILIENVKISRQKYSVHTKPFKKIYKANKKSNSNFLK
jgi:hypothetical protein